MPTPAAKISVWAWERCVCLKIQGRANFQSSMDFHAVITQLQARGFTHFILELSECSLMDSTFLGVLAGIGLKSPHNAQDPDGPCLHLRNANPRIAELLENIGVLHLFKTSQDTWATPMTPEISTQPAAPVSKVQLAWACLEAHQVLMQLNPENVERFKDVTKFLAEDLARLKGEKS